MKRLIAVLSGLVLAVVLSFAQAAPAAAAPQTPVIFIHGFAGKGEQWSTMRNSLVSSGYPRDRLHVFSYDWARSNKTIAGQLSSYVDGVRAQHGVDKVHLVSHSMGGLSSRWYIKNLGGAQKVDRWISIGGPNNGTNVAGLCPSLITPCKEMRHGSSFLNELNSGNPTPGPTVYTTFRSPCDVIISPTSSTSLSGANNIRTGCLEHISMMWSSEVISGVRGTIT
ncbi:esterase/lipase family protein [Nocardiopsis lambiniae]|uniref:Alpha/beta fold hydrolase n=1 Tax=Nocardiopsis lambiniae TaxID=3075539 RepID=A0ABU2MAI7_9ACTN|nr:alpha/beta fold hydrolase [Nocardiopsis sp. DSM 44743]MDT0329688.1 alpha/beta fold hydrolase [Nocardiopsis sp. DSM 44743]